MRGLLRQVLASKANELDTEAERLARLLGEICGGAKPAKRNTCLQLEAEQERLERAHLRTRCASCGSTRICSGKRRSNWTARKIASHSTGSAAKSLTRRGAATRRGQIEQAAAQLAQVEERATQHGKASRLCAKKQRDSSNWSRKLLCADTKRPRKRAHSSRESPNCSAQPPNWARNSISCMPITRRRSGRWRITPKPWAANRSRARNCSKNRWTFRERDRSGGNSSGKRIGERAQKLGEEVHARAGAELSSCKQNEHRDPRPVRNFARCPCRRARAANDPRTDFERPLLHSRSGAKTFRCRMAAKPAAISAPWACWPITPKSSSNTKRDRTISA